MGRFGGKVDGLSGEDEVATAPGGSGAVHEASTCFPCSQCQVGLFELGAT